jgi:hypothetical protein
MLKKSLARGATVFVALLAMLATGLTGDVASASSTVHLTKSSVGHGVVKGYPGITGSRVGQSRLLGGPFYFYAGRNQAAVTSGAASTMDAETPYLDTANDYHITTEISVEKTNANGHQIVELGWDKDPALYGDSNAHVFVYWWKDGLPKCYNTACAGFVQIASPAPQAGQTLTTGVAASKRYQIQYSATNPAGAQPGAWWFYLGGSALGYIPNTAWGTSAFSQSDKVQMFGEVAAGTTSPCSDMGTGTQGSTAAVPAAFMSSNGYVSGPAVSMTTFTTNSSWYSVGSVSNFTFYEGGPGSC